MILPVTRTCASTVAVSCARLGVFVLLSALFLGLAAPAQTEPQTAPAATPDTQAAPAPAPPPEAAPAQTEPQTAPAAPPEAAPGSVAPPTAVPSGAAQPAAPGEITEEELKKLLVGKELFLRGGYLDNSLSFNEHGVLIGRSPQGSYTLNGIQITKVRLTKHKVVFDGDRYALHFLGALPYEDPTAAVDRVKITPRKKFVRITVDREQVVKPKPIKEKGKPAGTGLKTAPPAPPSAASTTAAPSQPAEPSHAGQPSQPAEPEPKSGPSEAQAEIAAAPPAERPADPNSVTITISPAHANKVLKDALENVFAEGFDARMMASMPGFWKLYYEAAAEKTDYRPKDPAVLRQNAVDTKARLVSTFEPPSNQFAQDYGIAGMCSYHVVVGADGKPGEIAVARPIGFGLDESAVNSIRRASFEPAIKDGSPVPVMLDLIVQFRIYSKRTEKPGEPQTPDKPSEPSLPGPYSVQH